MKALIVGGGNGIGLSFARQLNSRGYEVIIIDKHDPNCSDFIYKFKKINLISCNYDIFNQYLDVDVLIITAGFGRVDYFNNLYLPEINNITLVNSLAYAKLLNIFSTKLYSNKDFYCLAMGSIAGLIVSPLFSVYGSTKV